MDPHPCPSHHPCPTLGVLGQFAQFVARQDDPNAIVWGLARFVVAGLSLEDCVVYLFDRRRGQLIQRSAFGPKSPDQQTIIDPIALPLGQGVVGSVAARGQSELVTDTRGDHRYVVDDCFRLSELAVPLSYDGELLGVLDSEHSKSHFFKEIHRQQFELLAHLASAQLTLLRAQGRLRRSALVLESQFHHHRRQMETLQNALEDLEPSVAQTQEGPREPAVSARAEVPDSQPVAKATSLAPPDPTGAKDGGRQGDGDVAVATAEPLDASAFDAAVQRALRHCQERDRLEDNPLLDSALVIQRAGGDLPRALRVGALRQVLAEAVAHLEAQPKTQRYGRVLRATYLRPLRQQQQVAEALNLAYSTYRRHLTRARTLVTRELWHWEQGQQLEKPAAPTAAAKDNSNATPGMGAMAGASIARCPPPVRSLPIPGW
ncbi:MAG: GAF domain-containing protein [Candidatus Competibacterales bacterium]